jgi:hypothetical protein
VINSGCCGNRAAAREDIERFARDGTIWFEWGAFKKTMAGIGCFLWFWISYGIFYGIAGVVGSSIK